MDGDGDVDLNDYSAFAACLEGPGSGIDPGCAPADLDADIDIDLADFAGFADSFTGTL
jgi:hypothetical protein